ncbi:MAG TPA: hypothetical protein VIM59_16490 [Cellvibrio sp.]
MENAGKQQRGCDDDQVIIISVGEPAPEGVALLVMQFTGIYQRKQKTAADL